MLILFLTVSTKLFADVKLTIIKTGSSGVFVSLLSKIVGHVKN